MEYVTLHLTQPGLELVLKALKKQPYEEVHELIDQIRTCVRLQVEGAQNAGLANSGADLRYRRPGRVPGSQPKDGDNADAGEGSAGMEKGDEQSVGGLQRRPADARCRVTAGVETTGYTSSTATEKPTTGNE